jgi:glucose-1-phosphate thymidylyltransferase
MVAFRDLQDIELVRSKFGVALLEGSKVINFEEKPAEPKSSLASTMCYMFNKQDLALTKQLIEEGSADNGGDLIKALVEQSEVHGFVFEEEWFDIGSIESLEEAKRCFYEY